MAVNGRQVRPSGQNGDAPFLRRSRPAGSVVRGRAKRSSIGNWQHWNWQHFHIGNILFMSPRFLALRAKRTGQLATAGRRRYISAKHWWISGDLQVFAARSASAPYQRAADVAMASPPLCDGGTPPLHHRRPPFAFRGQNQAYGRRSRKNLRPPAADLSGLSQPELPIGTIVYR